MKQLVVTDEILEQCYIIIADIVSKTDSRYLPIFKRIHEERQRRDANAELRNTAIQIAKQNTKK